MQFNRHTHELLAFISNPPTSGMGDFSDQSSDMESFKYPCDTCAITTKHSGLLDEGSQTFTDVAVAEALDGMFAPEYGLKQSQVVVGGGVESAIGAAADFQTCGTSIDESISGRGIMDPGQGIQITPVGSGADLGIAIQIGNTFCHGEPIHDGYAFTGFLATSNAEAVRPVNHGLDAQEHPEFIVHFNGIFADLMFETEAFLPGIEGLKDFVLELRDELAA